MALLFAKNNSMSAITTLPSGIGGGSMNLISTQTASSSSTISFTSGIDSTYKEYIFKFINIHPATNQVAFTFNGSIDSGSNYNVAKTTTYFIARHTENDATTELTYETGFDLAQGTGFQSLVRQTGNGNDECCAGYLHLYDPSSTTFIKHYMARFNDYEHNDQSTDNNSAGYFNTTSAIDAIQFKFGSGNIDSGTIKLYGIS